MNRNKKHKNKERLYVMLKDIESILVSEEKIAEISTRIAEQINHDYANSGK